MSVVLEVSNVKLPLDAGLPAHGELINKAAAAALGVSRAAISAVRVLKRSVDARKKTDVHFVATLAVEFADAAEEERALLRADARGGAGEVRGTHVKRHAPYKGLSIPPLGTSSRAQEEPQPIVVGAGPAGLFCALYLARAGLRPVVVERGGDVDERADAIAAFNAGGSLDVCTNIQFGAGGAGTFSDGKLTTNIKSPFAACVLHWFAEAGAPSEILWQAKPHIGTDLLVNVVRTLCEYIEEAGGQVLFHTQMTDVAFKDGSVSKVELLETATGVCAWKPARRVVLACGHSARDTFELLFEKGLALEQKPFSVGVRIEHPQHAINQAQYGAAAKHPALGAADYKLAVHLPSGRSVYTFCMCPGGEVVCAASEPGGVVVNGMSRYARDGENANSALLVGVGPEDFGSDHPLAGVELQRHMERAAYETALAAGGVPYAAPAQTVGDFLAGRKGKASATVYPSYARGVAWCDLHTCLPPFVADALTEAFPLLDRKLHGFANSDAVMCGVETRSSSPVRIVRGNDMQARFTSANDDAQASVHTNDDAQASAHANKEAPSNDSAREGREPEDCSGLDAVESSGIYPCGEGAGYAGGIMSAACDGLRVAQALCQAF